MDQLSYAEIVSSLALVTAMGALGWNIIRDTISEKVAIEFSIAFGEVGNIKSSNTVMFADAGSLHPHHYFDNLGMLVQIINTGRKSVGVSSVGGEFNSGEWLSMAVDGLPKMLQPYEIFSTTSEAKQKLIEKIQRNEIKNLWVTDTKGKKWLLSKKGWDRLRSTTDYIASNKHIVKK